MSDFNGRHFEGERRIYLQHSKNSKHGAYR